MINFTDFEKLTLDFRAAHQGWGGRKRSNECRNPALGYAKIQLTVRGEISRFADVTPCGLAKKHEIELWEDYIAREQVYS